MAQSVLVCDDTDDIRIVLEILLRREGYEVVSARTGDEGLRAVMRSRPDLVILDVGLPGLDGWQVLAGIRTISSVPIVMLTGHSSQADRAQGMRGGVTAYITKPFNNGALLTTVRDFIGSGDGGGNRVGDG